ncbi:C4-type zinc finger protein, DksA/TraR family [Escherichia coli]|uniref:C4-type zinc finger protein, DksA/TraR family n=1 Tax=Escherichia coli TaxID=562 RepID=A0A376YG24_ECOLX|nr:C4-type zinc finger protein, DksA/TraR family [Escherichia coli]
MPDNVDFIQEQQAELLERQINAARVKTLRCFCAGLRRV